MAFISDIEQLSYLEAVARRFSIKFRLHGGVAFRCVRLFAENEGRKQLDLFDLAPFAADVDLLHSGTDAQTPDILEHLLEVVPDADCFRWELRTEASEDAFSKSLRVGATIPARTLSIVDDGTTNLIDPAAGFRDIAASNYRFFVSPFFKESELYKNGRDLPILSALLYLQTLFEASVTPDKMQHQEGWPTATRAFAKHGEFQTLALLQQSSYLRARFRYLLLNAFAAAPTEKEFSIAAEQVGLRDFISSVQFSFPTDADTAALLQLSKPDQFAIPVLTSSSCTIGDIFRIPFAAGDWLPPVSDLDMKPGRAQTLLLVSPELGLKPGVAPSAVRSAGSTMEFIHFRLSQRCTQFLNNFDERHLSAVLQLKLSANHTWMSFALPCVVFKRTATSTELRMNCFDYLAGFASTGTAKIRVCMVGLDREAL